MSPGVRRMPPPIVFPTVTARPNDRPRIRSSDRGGLVTRKDGPRVGESARDGDEEASQPPIVTMPVAASYEAG